METQEKIEFPGVPLAVYREIAAHLCQVEGVSVELMPQLSQHFDYDQSQIAGLCISWAANSPVESRQLVQEILAYYRQRYGC